MVAADKITLSLLSPDNEANISDYCPEITALIKDYYMRAKENGLDPGDKELRFKMSEIE
jgi:hypothetical protein